MKSITLTILLASLSLIINAQDVRIMSYNVHNAIGLNKKQSIEEISTLINKYKPDVIALQELDSVTTRSKGKDILVEIAKRTVMHPTYAPAINFQGGKYGIGLLSKEIPIKTTVIPLPGTEEKRVAIIAEFTEYIVCNAHFSLTKKDRLTSIELITEKLKKETKPVIFTGDLNALPDSELISKLKENFQIFNDTTKRTYPSNKPTKCIDYICGFKQNNHTFTVKRKQVITNTLASDHLPVYVDVYVNAKKSEIFRIDPFIQDMVNNKLSISWFTNVNTHSWIEYGTTPELGSIKETLTGGQVISNNRHHKIAIDNLTPGQKYYYRACSREITIYQAYYKEFGDTAYSDIYSFTIPKKDETDFTAIIFNDLHKHKETMSKLLDNMENIDYDLVFFNGDCIDDPKNEADVLEYLSFSNNQVDATSKPVFYIRGNHEIRNSWSVELNDVIDCIGETTYGAFSWGDTRFVILDCGEDKPDDHWVYYNLNHFEEFRYEQKVFLEKEIKSSEFKKSDKRVLIHHIPIYQAKAKKYNPSFDLWHPVLKKADFNLAVNGHTHSYEYNKKGEIKNNFPVIIGGGYDLSGATLTILTKKGKTLNVKVVNADKETLLDINL